jgi:O-succinylbenzoate synthase
MDSAGPEERTGTPTAAWAALGIDSALTLDSAELSWVDLPFRHPITTSVGTHSNRPLVLVRLLCRSGGRTVEGWGECAALGDTAFHREDVTSAFDALARSLLSALVTRVANAGGSLPGMAALADLAGTDANAPMAFAALEMAVADAHLRAEGRSFADLLGVAGRSVPVGAVVGIHRSVGDLTEEVTSLAEEGYSRVKLKIGPGWDLAPVAAVTTLAATASPYGSTGNLAPFLIQVDANGSYREEETEHLSGLDRYPLLCIEQPLEPGDLDAHARLAARLATPICLDEDLDAPARIVQAVTTGACSVVCLKPARLGGLGAALRTVEWCRESATPLWLGGMFESGYARGVIAAVAALRGFSWPGDLSPASRYLAEDLVPAPVVSRQPEDGALAVRVPTVPGMGPVPDPVLLARRCVRRLDVVVPGR